VCVCVRVCVCARKHSCVVEKYSSEIRKREHILHLRYGICTWYSSVVEKYSYVILILILWYSYSY